MVSDVKITDKQFDFDHTLDKFTWKVIFFTLISVSFPLLEPVLKPLADRFAPVQDSRFWFLRMAKQVIQERKQNSVSD